MDYPIFLKLRSTNAKTGPIPVSTSTRKTCPPTCAFFENGCYAELGPLKLHWDKVTKGERGTDWAGFCSMIKDLPDDQLWRHNQAGDLPGDGVRVDQTALLKLVTANVGKRGFTYTHYPVTGESNVEAQNRQAIQDANDGGFTVNLSGNNLAHADHLASLDIGPVVTVMPADATENTVTPEGRKVIVCPATIKENVSCATCQLCQRQRAPIVGFPAHGSRKRWASAVAEST